jgi:anti-sigma-K factor RskA
MDPETLHELTAAYVLDALDAGDRQEFEQHLAACARCREEVAELSTTAASLAYAVPPVNPPPELRGRILDAARAERPNVVPLRPRWAVPAVAAAAVAACAAVGLGIWNVSLHDQLDEGSAQALARVPISGASGSLVVDTAGSGVLVVSDLAAAPAGRTYEAWVIKGAAVRAAGLFHGGASTEVVSLSRPVPVGAEVAVTVEPAGGSAAPTRKPFIVSGTV